jgi:DNA-binding transcriptional MocR family regulator
MSRRRDTERPTVDATDWAPRRLDPAVPAAVAVADAIADAIARGRLRQGDRLPTHRGLAALLGVTPRTVARAYAEADRRGLVTGLVGSGTYVRAAFGAAPGSDALDLASLHPPISDDADPVAAMRAALHALAAEPARLYRATMTEASADAPGALESAAQWVSHKAFRPTPENVLFTTGAQQALTLALMVLEPAGGVVLTTRLTNPGLLAAAATLGLSLRAVAADEQGMRADALDEMLVATGASVVHLQTTLANPTGVTATRARREEIADVLARRNVTAVEDDSLAPLAPSRPVPVAAFAPRHTCHISSTTKTLALGLRVGILVSPPPLRAPFGAALRATTWLTPALQAEVFDVWVRDGTAGQLLAARIDEITRRRRIAASVLPHAFAGTDPRSPHTWLALPAEWTDAEFTAALRDVGVLVSPGSEHRVAGSDPTSCGGTYGVTGAGGARVALNEDVPRDRLAEALQSVARVMAARRIRWSG